MSPAGLGGVIAFGPDHESAVECRCSEQLRGADWRSTGGLLEKYWELQRTSVLLNQEDFRRRPGSSTGMLTQPDDTPGRTRLGVGSYSNALRTAAGATGRPRTS